MTETRQINFGDMLMKRVGDNIVHGRFIGMHPVGPAYVPLMVKGRIIGKRLIKKQEVPFIQPLRIKPAHDNKYDHNALERFRFHNSLANECGMELVP